MQAEDFTNRVVKGNAAVTVHPRAEDEIASARGPTRVPVSRSGSPARAEGPVGYPLFDFFSRLAARFSSKVLAGFFFVSFFRSIPLLITALPINAACRGESANNTSTSRISL